MEKSNIIFKLYPNASVVSEDGIVYDENKQVMTIDEDLVNSELETQRQAEETKKQAKEDLKASAKAKLIAGEPLTEEEANTIVL